MRVASILNPRKITASFCRRGHYTHHIPGQCYDGALLLQVSAIKQGIAELRAGLKKAEAEISTAADLVGADEGAALMAQFAT